MRRAEASMVCLHREREKEKKATLSFLSFPLFFASEPRKKDSSQFRLARSSVKKVFFLSLFLFLSPFFNVGKDSLHSH